MTNDEFQEKIEAISVNESDPFWQGFKSASVICEMFGITPEQFAKTITELPVYGDGGQHQKRDAGALLWCRQQQEQQQ